VANLVEPALHQVLGTGTIVSSNISGTLSSRKGVLHWTATYFPLMTLWEEYRDVWVP
jgi:hypothetical protein